MKHFPEFEIHFIQLLRCEIFFRFELDGAGIDPVCLSRNGWREIKERFFYILVKRMRG